jgi:uracil-DNA glycosylase family 4
MGDGPKKSKIMVIGEAPGEREDEEHAAFVGASGALLDELLEECGISRADCYITNVAKCRPPENDTPDKPHIKVCVSEYLSQEFNKVDPEYVLLLGNSALYGVLGKWDH